MYQLLTTVNSKSVTEKYLRGRTKVILVISRGGTRVHGLCDYWSRSLGKLGFIVLI